MCGIAGYQTANGAPLPDTVLDAFARLLAHRGPDGAGRHVAGGTGLAQTRLAIIDLKTGDQPLFGPNGTALIANGEIYNYLELRKEFPDDAFATHSDCELPLFTFERAGERFSDPLRGMYAIALSDPRNGSLSLSRDPFGIKPLYYAQTGKGLIFASEPRAIFASGLLAPKIVPEKATELLQLQFTTGEQTIYEDVLRLPPGSSKEFRSGRMKAQRTHHALRPGPVIANEEEALRLLDDALIDSVEVHQRSDVPYGMFLSGGIDSSALIACMARLNERPVRAFTAGFPDTGVHDEREHARRVANAVGAEHVEIAVTEKNFWESLPAIVAAMDDPVADYAIVPSYLLAREAGKELKVVLCGEGGDELFAGYGRYRRATRPWWLGGRRMYARGAMDGLGILRDESGVWRQGIELAERAASFVGRSRLQVAQAVDVAEWLPNDLLIKLDRCLMAHGVEGRTPFLDPVVADLAFRLPDDLKVRGKIGKYLLRRWLERALPEANPFARKRGFTVPVGYWISAHSSAVAPFVAKNAGISEICRPAEAERLFAGNIGEDKRQAKARWHLLFYALWHRIHIEGANATGDVMSVLEGTN
jgi:asparagine synthase (glutamine-hydrolysing)